MGRMPVIHIIDDDDSFREAVSRLLRVAGYDVRGHANAGSFLLAERDDAPGCILMDLRMPGPGGLDLQQALAARADALPIIFVSGHGDIPSTVRAIQGGATDFLTKPVARETLLGAIRSALERDAERHSVREQAAVLRARYDELTGREREVLERVVAGKMNKEIAGELGAAERTVKAHRAKVMQKMRAGSLAELVQIAVQLQIGKPAPAHSAPPSTPGSRRR